MKALRVASALLLLSSALAGCDEDDGSFGRGGGGSGGVLVVPDGEDDESPGTGAVLRVTVTCAESGCGRTGRLLAQVKDCGTPEDPVLASAEQSGVTLLEGQTVTVDVPAPFFGEFCARAFLDSDYDDQPGSGDVISGIGEVPVLLVGEPTGVGIRLDRIEY